MTLLPLLQSGVGLLMLALVAIVHIAFAMAIKRDAEDLVAMRAGLFLVSPALWAFATLLGGVTVAVAYWAIHYSTLRPQTANRQTRDPAPGTNPNHEE